MGTVKRDSNGRCIWVSSGGLVKIDGIPVCRRIARQDGVYLQFLDPDKERSEIRTTNLVEVRLDALINKMR